MYKQKVLEALKPKAKAFGFNTKELEGIAESISNNLKLEENASDEDVNAAIDNAINAVLPVFTQAQSMANRVIEKKTRELAAQASNNAGGENGGNGSQENQNNGNGNGANGNGGNGNGADNNGNNGGANKGNDDNGKAIAEQIAAALKPFTEKIDALNGVINAMQTEKTTTTRKQRLEKLLENSGAFGTRTLKNFAKMSFDSDDEFNEFLTDVESDLKAYNQERADAGLQQFGVPPTQNPLKTKPEVKPLTEQEIKDLVDSL